jgi:hypothetical protein
MEHTVSSAEWFKLLTFKTDQDETVFDRSRKHTKAYESIRKHTPHAADTLKSHPLYA